METPRHKQLIIRNDLSELGKVQAFLEELEAQGLLAPTLSMPVNLVLEEALTNVIFYAYEQGSVNEIRLDINFRETQLEIIITDSGKAFDPTAREDPDINLPAEERPIGGLGIFLIKKIMDEVRYERIKDQNILTMIKHIT